MARNPNPACPKCHGKHVNVYKRQYEACPTCWPKTPKNAEPLEVPGAKPVKKTAGKARSK